MKNWIIKSNEWYDNIVEPKRFLLMIFVVLMIIIISHYFFVFLFPIFALIVVLWRDSYSLIKK